MASMLPFRSDIKLTDFLKNNGFTSSAEIIPPRNGSEQAKIMAQVETLIKAGAQFLAVTKGAGGSLRGGSLPISQIIKENFQVPCIAHFTCRDLTAQDCENQLMDHHYFGIRNILALRGDPPTEESGSPSQWQKKEGGYDYAYELIAQIRNLNEGIYLTRKSGPQPNATEKTDFCIGAAAYPEHPNEEERLKFFKLKTEHGAQYGITDMCFDPEIYARFVDLCAKNHVNVPILPGTRILKSKDQAGKMAQKFKVSVPKDIFESLPEKTTPHSMERGVELFLKLTERMKTLGAPGIHLYVIADTESASAGLRKLAHARSTS
jgi:methylenetetrahydrofolate reductase (NADPH)